MADSLVLRLSDADSDCAWVIVDPDGRLVEARRTGPLESARAAATGRRLIVLVPGSDVITTCADLPATLSKSRLRQMLPFSLEEHFAEDISHLHFAAGSRNAAGELGVSAVARARLDDWLERLAHAGLAPAAIYADTDGVADTPSTLNVIVDNETIYARRPGEAALSLTGLGLADAFAMLAGDEGDDAAPVQHALLCLDEAARRDNEQAIEELSSRFSTFDVKVLADDALQLFAAKLANHPGANLLQGSYAPKSNWAALLRPWRVAAALAGALVAVMLLGTIAEYVKLRQVDAALTNTIESRCRELYSANLIRQCEAEVQNRLRSLGEASTGGEQFLVTLAQVASITGDADQLRQLSYRNSIMDMQILMPSVPALDDFSRRLSETGDFTVSIQSTNPQQDGGVEARVQIVAGNR